MQQGINIKLFKLTLLVLSVAMLLFSCTAGQNSGGSMISTHKYINFQSVTPEEPLQVKDYSGGLKESGEAFSRQ
jgi:hypothetical protein